MFYFDRCLESVAPPGFTVRKLSDVSEFHRGDILVNGFPVADTVVITADEIRKNVDVLKYVLRTTF